MEEIIFSPETKLGKIFNIIERIGYLNVGILAFEKSIEYSKNNPILAMNLQWLVNNVLGLQLEKLINYAKDEKDLETYLRKNKLKIDKLFKEIDMKSFDCYETDQYKKEALDRYHSAQSCWEEYRKKLK
ncbi:hypothetical protein KBD45_01135 [Candidatus Dojkabacteria bacterium]|nr:hypothetical protein [Candidatus Dojkabacteria bacterium]